MKKAAYFSVSVTKVPDDYSFKSMSTQGHEFMLHGRYKVRINVDTTLFVKHIPTKGYSGLPAISATPYLNPGSFQLYVFVDSKNKLMLSPQNYPTPMSYHT